LTEIIYNTNSTYNSINESHYDIIRHSDYRQSFTCLSSNFKAYNKHNFTNYAYGLLINPCHTPVLVLDIDNDDEAVLNFVINLLMSNNEVETIDIAISSISSKDKNKIKRHLYAGLTSPYNLISFYDTKIYGTCYGFNNLIVQKGEIVIRTSQKFINNIPDPYTTITWEKGYTKIGDNKWLQYTSEQLIVPSIFVGASCSAMLKKESNQKLKLRG